MLAVAAKVAVVEGQNAVPGKGPGRAGGGPPSSAGGIVGKISAGGPPAALQASEARRIRRSRVR